MTMLTKQFKKFLKENQKERSSSPQPPQKKKFYDSLRQNPTVSMERTQTRIKYFECEGYEHMYPECANVLKGFCTKAMNYTLMKKIEEN